MSKKIKRKIKLNAPLRGYAAGTVLQIEVDKDGTPLERYYRDRLKDAKTDKCVEFVGNKQPAKSANEGGKNDAN